MYRGRPWTIRQYAGFGSAEETNARFRYLLERGQTGLSVAFDLPTQLGYDSDDPHALGEVGRTGVAIDSIEDMRLLLDGIPLGEVSTSMTINAPAVAPAPPLRARRRGAGRPRLGASRHGPERHPQGVHRARELHLSAAAVDAADHRPLRLLRRADPEVEHDLDLRLPHPRGRLDGGAGARLHARERDRLRGGGGRRGPLPRRVRRAPLLLLQRAQPLLPGGGEVPRRAPAVGDDHARPLRRDEPEGARPPLPRADRRLDADRAAAREQHRPRRHPGALRGRRRRAEPAHERLRRGARAPDRALGQDRPAHAADPRRRGRSDRHRRPARRLLLHRSTHGRARGARDAS